MTGEFAVGVHALVFLNHKKTVVSSEMVAENVCTNPARVRKILASLKKAGLVSTKEGLDGGYQFSADASKVNLCMIADALGVAFVSSSWKSGNLEKNCLIASGMAVQQLDQKCREELKHITIADLEGQIFNNRKKAAK